jgi:hypothetical protein
VVGYVLGPLITLACITLGRRFTVNLWRNPSYADMHVTRIRPFTSYIAGRGATRGTLPLFAGVGFGGIGVAAAAALPAGPVAHDSPVFVLATVTFALAFIGLGLIVSIILFNRPLTLVPPYMRGEDGLAIGWWRCRDLPADQRQIARRQRRKGPLGHPAPPPGPPLSPVPGGGVIALSRVEGVRRDRLAEYQIAMDGKRVAMIIAGERVELPVPPGRHTVFVQDGWARSPRLEVDAQPGQMIELECAPGTLPPYGHGVDNYVQLTRAGQIVPANGVG